METVEIVTALVGACAWPLVAIVALVVIFRPVIVMRRRARKDEKR